jgi:hypothetical protein
LQETFLLEGDISPAGTIDMFPRGIELAGGDDGAGDTLMEMQDSLGFGKALFTALDG